MKGSRPPTGVTPPLKRTLPTPGPAAAPTVVPTPGVIISVPLAVPAAVGVVPPPITVGPVYELAPVMIRFPAPTLVNPARPLMPPLRVNVPSPPRLTEPLVTVTPSVPTVPPAPATSDDPKSATTTPAA